MPIKVIFLDIDGVLNGDDSPPLFSEGWPLSHLETHLIEKINKIADTLDLTDESKTKIVISSSWRVRFSYTELVEMLKEKGLRVEVIDVTPRIIPRKMSVYIRRGQEIKEWLHTTREIIEKFVIIDDDSDMEDLKPRLIRTDYRIGITDRDVDRAIQMLKS